MKEELRTILPYLEHEEDEILIMRNSILNLDLSQPDTLENKIEYLNYLIDHDHDQANLKSHDYLGYYRLFLGCIYYEKGEYDNVISKLKRANPELWESQINKALVHWLLGISYSQMNKYSDAHEELKDALNTLRLNTRANSYQVEEQQQLKSRIRKRIIEAINILGNKSAHYLVPSPRIQERQKPPTILEKIMQKTFSTLNSQPPEQTSYEQSSEEKPDDFNLTPAPSVKPHTIHVTIPIDVNALEHMPVNSDCLTPDLAKKLRDFTESKK